MFLIPSLKYLVVQSDLFCLSSPPLLPYDDDVVIGGPPPPHLIKITCSGERGGRAHKMRVLRSLHCALLHKLDYCTYFSLLQCVASGDITVLCSIELYSSHSRVFLCSELHCEWQDRCKVMFSILFLCSAMQYNAMQCNAMQCIVRQCKLQAQLQSH